MNNYEGMFLFDPAVLTDWDSVQKELNRILGRADAQLIACGRWDERRLAYEINGRKRGVYALVYFRADPSKVVGIERDIQLSESALRCLVLRVDHMTEEDMKRTIEGCRPESQKTAGSRESESDAHPTPAPVAQADGAKKKDEPSPSAGDDDSNDSDAAAKTEAVEATDSSPTED